MTCVDNDGRALGMGVITSPGLVVQVTLCCARRLLRPDDTLQKLIGERFKCELVIGMNGQVL